jgi:SAM-dependent methyltransferase
VIDEPSVAAVERETARYYDLEEGREGRPLDPRRIAARGRFVQVVRASGREEPVLEIGTGPGREALALIEAGLDVIGVDVSSGHAARAASRGLTMVVASARALPFATGSIGALRSMSTLMHIPAVTIGGAMRELARVVAPGAAVAIGVWGGPTWSTFPTAPSIGGQDRAGCSAVPQRRDGDRCLRLWVASTTSSCGRTRPPTTTRSAIT